MIEEMGPMWTRVLNFEGSAAHKKGAIRPTRTSADHGIGKINAEDLNPPLWMEIEPRIQIRGI